MSWRKLPLAASAWPALEDNPDFYAGLVTTLEDEHDYDEGAPMAAWATQLGGTGFQLPRGITRDGGAIYVVGGLEGPAEWDSPDALSLIHYYLKRIGGAVDEPVKTSG